MALPRDTALEVVRWCPVSAVGRGTRSRMIEEMYPPTFFRRQVASTVPPGVMGPTSHVPPGMPGV